MYTSGAAGMGMGKRSNLGMDLGKTVPGPDAYTVAKGGEENSSPQVV